MAGKAALALVLLGCLSVSARTTHCEDIDDDLPGISISQSNKVNPSRFDIFCFTRYKWPNGTLISLEISLVPDKPPVISSLLGATSGLSSRRHIAFVNRFSSGKQPTLNPDLAEKGVSGRSNDFSVSFNAGTCEDTGLYRCQAVYLPTNETSFKVKVSEGRLPACLSGAIATTSRSVSRYRTWIKFVCRVNASLAVELVSLEVSVVRNGSRQVLAYINSFMNDAKVSYSSKDVLVEGNIYPLNPGASSLNISRVLPLWEESPQYITTCTAVYSGKNSSANPVESLANASMSFRK